MDGYYQPLPPDPNAGMAQIPPPQMGHPMAQHSQYTAMPPTEMAQPMAQHHQQPAMHLPQLSHGQPQFRTGQSIPAGTRVVSKHDPNHVYQPYDGPVGFGIYKESDEGPHSLNFSLDPFTATSTAAWWP